MEFTKPPRRPHPLRLSQTYTDELIPINHAVAVQIELIDHGGQVLLAQLLAELAGDAAQVVQADLARAVLVEEVEGAEDLVAGVAGEDHGGEEGFEGGAREEELVGADEGGGGGRLVGGSEGVGGGAEGSG